MNTCVYAGKEHSQSVLPGPKLGVSCGGDRITCCFPLDSGKFKTIQIIAESTYEVHGTRIISSDAQCRHSGAHPFGAYTQPMYHGDMFPPHPPRALGKTL